MSASDAGWLLVLDDDPIITRSIEALLAEEGEWSVASFNRAAEALRSLETQSYDAVISDFLMPEMDGIKFLKSVKEAQPFASRIMLTGYADKQNAIRSINEVGLYQYVEKPWDNDALLLILRNAVERARLLRKLEDKARVLSKRDRDFEALRTQLLKAIL
jgi:DNA-binding NtrC family response regulator